MQAEPELGSIQELPARVAHAYYRTGAAYVAVAILAAALAVVIATSYRVSFSGADDSCCVSEWLINYGGGFVRRGLGGAFILWIAGLSGLGPRVIVFEILAISYAVFFTALAAMVWQARKIDYLELLLVISPFAALFPVFHRIAGQRKEILMLALAAVAGVTGFGRLDSVAKYVCWSLLFAAIVAVHDGSIFFLPLFVIYLRAVTPARYPMGYRAVAILLPSAGVFLLGYLRSTHVDITAICAAMDAAAKGDWCAAQMGRGTPYAVAWLGASALDGVRSVVRGYTESPGPFLALLAGGIGLIPVVVALRRDAVQLRVVIRDLPLQQLFLWMSGLGMGVVFLVAHDGNRWLYIITVLLTLMHFAAQDGRMRAGDG
jgi:hypothetical protein